MGGMHTEPLEVIQVIYLLISQIIFQTLAWSFNSNMIVFVLCCTFDIVFLIAAIACKLIRIHRSQGLRLFKKSQISFVIPYALLAGEIYLYVWGFRTAQYYQNGSYLNQVWAYVDLVLLYFAYSLVCTPGLCSKLEYTCYIISMLFELCLLTYETAALIGLTPVYSSSEIMFNVLLQQSKDIKICFLSLFIASILIMMDYLNKTQEQAEKKKGKGAKTIRRSHQLQMLV